MVKLDITKPREGLVYGASPYGANIMVESSNERIELVLKTNSSRNQSERGAEPHFTANL